MRAAQNVGPARPQVGEPECASQRQACGRLDAWRQPCLLLLLLMLQQTQAEVGVDPNRWWPEIVAPPSSKRRSRAQKKLLPLLSRRSCPQVLLLPLLSLLPPVLLRPAACLCQRPHLVHRHPVQRHEKVGQEIGSDQAVLLRLLLLLQLLLLLGC